MKKIIIAAVCCAAASSTVQAVETSLIVYQMQMSTAAQAGRRCELGLYPNFASYEECVSPHFKTIKNLYDGMLKDIKNKTAKAALRDHYVVVIAKLNGGKQTDGERSNDSSSYTSRQAILSVRESEAWARFIVEDSEGLK